MPVSIEVRKYTEKYETHCYQIDSEGKFVETYHYDDVPYYRYVVNMELFNSTSKREIVKEVKCSGLEEAKETYLSLAAIKKFKSNYWRIE